MRYVPPWRLNSLAVRLVVILGLRGQALQAAVVATDPASAKPITTTALPFVASVNAEGTMEVRLIA